MVSNAFEAFRTPELPESSPQGVLRALVLPEWPLLWVSPGQLTVMWRTESYAVST